MARNLVGGVVAGEDNLSLTLFFFLASKVLTFIYYNVQGQHQEEWSSNNFTFVLSGLCTRFSWVN